MKLTVQRNKTEVGYCHLLQTAYGDYEIAYMKVDEAYRGKGLATQMLKRAMRIAEREGRWLVAFLDPDGTGLTAEEERAWLKRHGFKRDRYDLSKETRRTFAQYLRRRPNMKPVMVWKVDEV